MWQQHFIVSPLYWLQNAPCFQRCPKDEHRVHLKIDKHLRTMRLHCPAWLSATQTNANLLGVFIKSSRTPLHVITAVLLEVPIWHFPLPLLSAMVVVCLLAQIPVTKSPSTQKQISSITSSDLMKFLSWDWVVIFTLSTNSLTLYCRGLGNGQQHWTFSGRRKRVPVCCAQCTPALRP